jgi:uncharacterized protein (UPF0303 family)
MPHEDDDATAARLLEQERRLVLPALDERIAVSLGRLMLDRALANSLAAVIDVHVRGRHIFRAALPGTNDGNEAFLAGKRRWVEQSGHSSLLGSLAYRREHPGIGREHGDRVAEVGPFGGGVPLRTQDRELAGIAIVSGLTEEEDHELVIWALEQHLRTGEDGTE